MKSLFLVILTALSFNAFAIGLGNDNPPSLGGNSTNTNLNANLISSRIDNDVRANAASFAASNADSRSTATGGTGIASGGLAQAVSGGSQSGVNFEVNYPRAMGALGLGSLYPTAPCMGTSNIGGGNGFFTFGVGSSWTDDECGIRETARSFSGLGLKGDAVSVLCTSKYAAAAPVCKEKEVKE